MFIKKLPYILSYFLGYRKPNHVVKKLPVWRIYLWGFIAAWAGIAIIEIIFAYGPSFQSHHTPMIIASFGASAVLIYGVIESPLAQPRNVIGGQIIGAIVGVIISQLFLGIEKNWASEGQFTVVQWVTGATAMSLSLVVMQITKCVHPPGGATALIPAVTIAILDIKWFYIGVVALSSVIQVLIACLINNIERRYPLYWWAPNELPTKVNPNELAAVLSIPQSMHGPEDVVLDNLTEAEEGRLNASKVKDNDNDSDNDKVAQKYHNNFSSSTSSSVTTYEKHHMVIDQAITTLQKHAQNSDTKYILLTTNSLFHSPGISLTNDEKTTLETLIQKLNSQ